MKSQMLSCGLISKTFQIRGMLIVSSNLILSMAVYAQLSWLWSFYRIVMTWGGESDLHDLRPWFLKAWKTGRAFSMPLLLVHDHVERQVRTAGVNRIWFDFSCFDNCKSILIWILWYSVCWYSVSWLFMQPLSCWPQLCDAYNHCFCLLVNVICVKAWLWSTWLQCTAGWGWERIWIWMSKWRAWCAQIDTLWYTRQCSWVIAILPSMLCWIYQNYCRILELY